MALIYPKKFNKTGLHLSLEYNNLTVYGAQYITSKYMYPFIVLFSSSILSFLLENWAHLTYD
jgi:hypothetical protein